MKVADIVEPETLAAESDLALRLPLGLLGFEQVKEYLLSANRSEAPFQWLQVPNDPSLAFVVINPFVAAPNYQPEIPEDDVRYLGLQAPTDALLYNIVTLHGPNRATVNLKGPIVVNRHTLLGKQVVLHNAADYSVQQPLPVVN